MRNLSVTTRLVLVVTALFMVACQPSQLQTAAEDALVLMVDDHLVDCVGVTEQTCMRIKREPTAKWQYFYDEIRGFHFEEGFQYRLRVKTVKIPDPPEDGSSIEYHLLEVIEKTPAKVQD